MEPIITRKLSNGKTLTVDANSIDATAYVDGARLVIGPVVPISKQWAAKVPAEYTHCIYHVRMTVPLTAAEAQAIQVAMAANLASARAANDTPAKRARNEVSKMYAAAKRRIDYPGEYYPMLNAADAALAKWREDYPADAEEERKDKVRTQIAKLEELAQGAMLYDADGSIDYAGQCKRRDEFLTKAEALRATI